MTDQELVDALGQELAGDPELRPFLPALAPYLRLLPAASIVALVVKLTTAWQRVRGEV